MKCQQHEPYRKLKGALRERGITYSQLANTLKISETAVSHKINGKSDFYLSEVTKIENEYGIKVNIFFREKSCEFNNKNEE